MSHSPIEFFRKVPRGLLGMIALVAVFEGFVARNDLKFSKLEAHDWKTATQSARSGAQMGGVLCFGDSQIKFGLLPLVIESKLGQPVQSMAILGGQAPSSYFLLRKALESGARPSALVVDWESHLLKDDVDHNARMWPELLDVRDNLELSWTAGDASGFLRRSVGQLFPSVRERFEIRDNIKAALNGETPQVRDWIERSGRNMLMNRGAVALAKDHFGRNDNLARWGNRVNTPWYSTHVNTTYAKRFLKLAEQYKIPVYVMLMPVAPGMQQKYEMNGIDGPYTRWIGNLQRRFPDLVVVDLRHSHYEADVFYDPLHLDRDGAVSASLALGEYLRDHLEDQPAGQRWVQMPPYRPDLSHVAFEDTTRTYQIMTRPGPFRR